MPPVRDRVDESGCMTPVTQDVVAVIDAEAFEAAADDPRFQPMNEAADRNLRELRSQGRVHLH